MPSSEDLPASEPPASERGKRRIRQKLVESTKRLTRRELTVLRDDLSDDDLAATRQRPKTRGDCVNVPRPCPYVGCQHNLFLDVERRSGSIRYAVPNIEPDQMKPHLSCVLDVAENDGLTLEDIGQVSNLTRERMRQIIQKALAKALSNVLTSERKVLLDFIENFDPRSRPNNTLDSGLSSGALEQRDQEREEDSSAAVSEGPQESIHLRVRVTRAFETEDPRSTADLTSYVWAIYLRESVERGFEKDLVKVPRNGQKVGDIRIRRELPAKETR